MEVRHHKRLHIHALPVALFSISATFVIAGGLYFQQAKTVEVGRMLFTPGWHVEPARNGLAEITPSRSAEPVVSDGLNESVTEAGRAISLEMNMQSATANKN